MGKLLNPTRIINGRKAIVTINNDTLQIEWAGLEIGKRFKLVRKVDGGEVAYYFTPSRIEPTAEGSEFAWVTGKRVNGRGNPIDQITHLHCPEGERMELIHTSMVRGSK